MCEYVELMIEYMCFCDDGYTHAVEADVSRQSPGYRFPQRIPIAMMATDRIFFVII